MSSHVLKHKYLPAVTDLVGATPIIIPTIGEDFKLETVAPFVDGIMLTGSLSGVAPSCYGAVQEKENEILDVERDKTAFALIRSAIELDIPLFAICRGFQEVNVAMGGSLHQYVPGLPGMFNHGPDKTIPYAEQYEMHPHKVIVQKGGLFEELGLPAIFGVNTLHYQGVNELGQGLRVEAVAEDGLIEAVSLPGRHFFMGVQWHPESDYRISPVSVSLFKAFRDKMLSRPHA